MSLSPIPRKSLSDDVFTQLSQEIMDGRLGAGQPLPSERELSQMLHVNRGAVREAVKRLMQAGLVATQHGAGTQVLDFRRSAGLDLLPQLLLRGQNELDLDLVRSVMEMRSAMAIDVARLCARRATADTIAQLRSLVASMRSSAGDMPALQATALDLWDALVEGSGNVAYRMAFNSMRHMYDPVREAMAEVLAEELMDFDRCDALIDAIARRNQSLAQDIAKALVGQGLNAVVTAIDQLQDQITEPLSRQ